MRMKIVSLEIKKIEVGKFFPKENRVELDIFFNDGSDKEIFKMVDISDAKGSAEDIFEDLRKLEKNGEKSEPISTCKWDLEFSRKLSPIFFTKIF